MWDNAGLIGGTGFVGGFLARQIAFSRAYNSRTVEAIAGQRFDTLVCAGAPAAMWAANANPAADLANLQRLMAAMSEAAIGRLILISTIAVFDDVSKGYTESEARYETVKAYGKNRRELEVHAQERRGAIVIRLPALFGRGLKKNFVFDILNPVPSFIRVDKFAEVRAAFDPLELEILHAAFSYDAELAMYKLDRARLAASGGREPLKAAFERIGFLGTGFTNSDSAYQYYNLEHLKRDIETAAANGLSVLNVCSEPWRAGDLHEALTGKPFANAAAPLWKEDVRTEHAGAFGRSGPYLYSREEVLSEIRAFASAEARG